MARDEDDEQPAAGDADRSRSPSRSSEQGERAADRGPGRRADTHQERQRDTQNGEQPQQGGSQHPLTEEEAERLREQVPLDQDAEPGELEAAAAGSNEDEEGLTVFTKDQLIHEAAVHARGFYGKTKISLEPDTYGMRRKEEGYYDLVDSWIMAAQIMDDEYHEDFLRLSMPFHWSWRSNRHLIPNYYIIALKGIKEAMREEYIQPPFYHRIQFMVLTKFPPVTPPLAWYLKDQDALDERGKLETGEATRGRQGAQRLSTIEQKVRVLTQKFQEANEAGNMDKAKDYLHDIEELRDEYERLEEKIKSGGRRS